MEELSTYERIQIAWMLAMTGAIPFLLWLWRTGRGLGRTERRREDRLNHLTETVKREVERIEEQFADKVDAKYLDKIDLRLTYLERRLDETAAENQRRFLAAGDRLSKLTSKLTEKFEEIRETCYQLRERVIRLEEKGEK